MPLEATMSDRDLRKRIDDLEAEMIAQRFATHAIIDSLRCMPDDQQFKDVHYHAMGNLAVSLAGQPIWPAAKKALELLFREAIPDENH